MKILSSMSKGRAILAAAFAAVLCLAACNKENTPADPEPSAEIKNQIEYSEEPLISIKSVIYEAVPTIATLSISPLQRELPISPACRRLPTMYS